MSVPPGDDPRGRPGTGPTQRPSWPPAADEADEPAAGAAPPPAPQQGGPGQPVEPPLDFDPYRFGRPEHPIPPEYAPPGYRPPAAPASPYPPPPAPPAAGWPYGPPRSGPYRPQQRGNTKAVLALVLGILAIIFCWTTLLDLLLIVPAIVLGALGRSDAARDPGRGGRGLATAGLICGVVAVALAIAAGAYLYNRVKPCVDQYNVNSSQYTKCVTDRLF